MNLTIKSPDPESLAANGDRATRENNSSNSNATGCADVYQILNRIEKPFKSGPDSWRTDCWLCGGHSRKVSIRLRDDGRITIHCFGGCDAVDLLQALNLNLSDLYPDTTRTEYKPIRSGERWIPRDVIGAISSELLIVVCAAASMNADRPLPDDDKARLMLAANRIYAATQAVGL
jgi:hypothetical protein